MVSRFAKLGTSVPFTNAHFMFWIILPVLWSIPSIYVTTVREGSPLKVEIFTILHVLIIWSCCYVSTRLTAVITKAWSLKPILIIFLGALIGIMFLARPLLRASISLRAQWFPESVENSVRILETLPVYFDFSSEFLVTVLTIYSVRIFSWTVSAWFFFSFFGKPSFGIDQPNSSPLYKTLPGAEISGAKEGEAALPQFLSKIDPALGEDLIALKAEGHYLRVYTRKGNDLIYYRFKDAVAQLSGKPGAQVHRSYWISAENAKVAKDHSGKYEFHLPNDLIIPIGRTYKQSAREAGLLP